jgi:hypothetical protein
MPPNTRSLRAHRSRMPRRCRKPTPARGNSREQILRHRQRPRLRPHGELVRQPECAPGRRRHRPQALTLSARRPPDRRSRIHPERSTQACGILLSDPMRDAVTRRPRPPPQHRRSCRCRSPRARRLQSRRMCLRRRPQGHRQPRSGRWRSTRMPITLLSSLHECRPRHRLPGGQQRRHHSPPPTRKDPRRLQKRNRLRSRLQPSRSSEWRRTIQCSRPE